jgi:type IX secretion system PorP/SprF family membrane protein
VHSSGLEVLQFKTKWKRAVFCAVGLCLSTAAYPQYFQFSQYNFTSQRINPGMTGNTRYASMDLDSRTQRTGGDFNINSNFFSLSCPLLTQSTGVPWSGVGISVLDDHSSGIFKTLEASASYAVHIRVSRFQQLSFGVRGLYQSSRISLDGLYTGSQYVAERGFDASIPSGEPFQEARSHYTTFSTGLYWQQNDRKGNLTGYWGVSIFDFNKPQYSFFGSQAQLSSTLVFTGGFQAYKKNEFVIFPEILYTRSSGTNVLNVGTRFQYQLKQMPNQVADRIDLITKYVAGRSGIIGVQFHRENFSFGVSYDFPVVYTNAANLGALEIGLTLRKLVETRNRKSARRQQQARQKSITKTGTGKKTVTKTSTKVDSVATPKPPSEIEVVKTNTTEVKTNATAGKISQEPLMVEKITLHFHFEYNSVDLDDETETFLNELSTTLEEDNTLKLRIVGHTDNIGPEKFNQKLSQKRADAVKSYLLKLGIDNQRLTVEGKGMSEPLNGNETEEDRAKNRRVEILIYRE